MSKVMLVEDDNNLREIYEARLQAEGYAIVSAKDGEEALVLAKNEKPDLIISDVMMPKISGFEMLDILRNTEGLKEVKVIMLTALGQSDDQQRADRLGADRYLVKSQVTLEDIVKVAHELLQDSTSPEAAEMTTPAPATTASEPDPAPQETATNIAPTPEAAPPSLTPTPITDTTPPNETQAQTIVSIPAPPAASAPSDGSAPNNTDSLVADATTAPVPEPADSTAPADLVTPMSTSSDSPIENLVSGASTEPTTPVTTETPVTSTEFNARANSINDDKVMAEAVNTLVNDTAEPAVTITPAAGFSSTPAPEETPATTPTSDVETVAEPDTSNTGSVPIAHKKIITPLDSEPKQDINTLLALEEAREAAAAPPSAPTAIIADNETGPKSSPLGSNQEQPASPTQPTGQAATTAGNTAPAVDPNSIAL